MATSAELRARLHAEPVYLVEVALLNSGPTLYLSTRNITVSGQIYEHYVREITGLDAAVKRLDSSALNSNISIAFLNDPYGASGDPLIVTGETYPFERAPVTIKRTWLDADGTPATPETVFKGALDSPKEITRVQFHASCSTLPVALSRLWSQPRIDIDTYPGAIDDMGKPIPYVYGDGVLYPALRTDWGGRTTLSEAITASESTFDVADTSRFPSSGGLYLDAEEMTYTGKTATSFTGVTRGTGGTTAAVHGVGAIIWENQTYYKAVAAAHAVAQVSAVFAEVDGQLVTVPPASWVSALVGGRTEIQLAEAFKVSPEDSYTVIDGISVKTNSVDTSEEYTEIPSTAASWDVRMYTASTTQVIETIYFPSAPAGALSEIEVEVGFGVELVDFQTGDELTFFVAGVLVAAFNASISYILSNLKSTPIVFRNSSWWAGVEFKIVRYRSDGDYSTALDVSIHVTKSVQRAKRTVAKVGTVTLDGGVFYTRFAERLHVLIDGYKDDASGTYTGTPYTVIKRPDHTLKHFLVSVMGHAAADIETASFAAAGALYASAIAGGYVFAFATVGGISDLARFARDLARQARSSLRWVGGKWYLDFLPDSAPAAVVTVTEAEVVGVGAEPVFQNGAEVDIVNEFHASWAVDYSHRSQAQSPWNGTKIFSDSTSQAKYGDSAREGFFPAVASQLMVEDVVAHMLLQSATPLKRVHLRLPLEYSALTPGDTIELTSTLFTGRKWFIEDMRTRATYIELTAVEWWA